MNANDEYQQATKVLYPLKEKNSVENFNEILSPAFFET